MKASRRTQPFRKGTARTPGTALSAAMRGRTAWGGNPMDLQRRTLKRRKRRRKPGALTRAMRA